MKKIVFFLLCFGIIMVNEPFQSQAQLRVIDAPKTKMASQSDTTLQDAQRNIELTGRAEKNKEVLEEFEIISEGEQLVIINVQFDDGDGDRTDIIEGYIIVDGSGDDKKRYTSGYNSYSESCVNTRSLILNQGKHTISILVEKDVDYTININFVESFKQKPENSIYYNYGSMKEDSLGFKLEEKKKVKVSIYSYDVTSQFVDEYDEEDEWYDENWVFLGTQKEYKEAIDEMDWFCDDYSEIEQYHKLSGDYVKSYTATKILNAGTYMFDFTSIYDCCEIVVEDLTVYPEEVKGKNSKSISLLEDSTTKWKYSVLPQNITFKSLEWNSSNKKIARVTKNGTQCVSIKGIKPGKCKLTTKLKNGSVKTVSVVVKARNPKLNYKKKSLLLGETVKLKLNYAKNKVKYWSSDKKIATVTKNGKVKAKARGKCKIWAKCGKKKYCCKIIVKKTDPNFFACLYDYNTRNNYFVVKFKNIGKTSITIKKGIKVIDVDYKSYDRNVSIRKSVTIKPGKTKYIRFYVQGSNTWYNYRDFTLYYKFVFDHKEYEGHVWDDNSVFQEGKSWYTTYWKLNSEEYEDWY